ncbi:MAG: RidA family protein [Gemmatimonadetes bacterium]|nr:RidA family protein [Gemmatimonadota bacterium]
MHRILQPADWKPPRGYSNGVEAHGRQVFVAGQIGWNAAAELVSDDLVAQTAQALRNVVAIVAEAGGRPEHIVRLTWYVTSRDAYVAAAKPIGAVYREIMGRHFPAMSAVEVTALVEKGAKVEIEATAVIPDGHAAGGPAAID